MKEKSIYINDKLYEYYTVYHEFDFGGYGESKVSFLIDKIYMSDFPIKINNFIYQHGMTLRLSKDNDLYWYLINNPVMQIYEDVYARPGYFELIIKGKREKIDELIVLRDIKINELV